LGLAFALEFFELTDLLEHAEACRNGIKTIFYQFWNRHVRLKWFLFAFHDLRKVLGFVSVLDFFG
jgi:hypothetical protein